MKVYDDQSDLDTCMTLLEKLMVEDKVDFTFAGQHGLRLRRGEGRERSRLPADRRWAGARSIEELLPIFRCSSAF